MWSRPGDDAATRPGGAETTTSPSLLTGSGRGDRASTRLSACTGGGGPGSRTCREESRCEDRRVRAPWARAATGPGGAYARSRGSRKGRRRRSETVSGPEHKQLRVRARTGSAATAAPAMITRRPGPPSMSTRDAAGDLGAREHPQLVQIRAASAPRRPADVLPVRSEPMGSRQRPLSSILGRERHLSREAQPATRTALGRVSTVLAPGKSMSSRAYPPRARPTRVTVPVTFSTRPTSLKSDRLDRRSSVEDERLYLLPSRDPAARSGLRDSDTPGGEHDLRPLGRRRSSPPSAPRRAAWIREAFETVSCLRIGGAEGR